MSFECNKGCTKCCEDTIISIEPTLEDTVRISERRGISIVEFFDEALVARFVPQSDEIRSNMKIPCPYIGDVGGYEGCTMQDYKPLECAIAPEDRAVSTELDLGWKHCKIGSISKSRKRQIIKLHLRHQTESIATMIVLYTPHIIANEDLLIRDPEFRKVADLNRPDEEIVEALNNVLDRTYKSEIRRRYELFQEDFAKYGTVGEVLNSRSKNPELRNSKSTSKSA